MIKTFSSIVVLAFTLLTTIALAQPNSRQGIVDDKVLTEFFSDNKINPTRTPSGLYYVIRKQGSGENAKPGQKVSMKYIGKFLDGKVFDGNMDANYNLTRNAFSFTLGNGSVIRGWDEGVQLLSPGTRATFYLPSSLGYGSNPVGPIPANSVLVFDVELISIDK